MMNYPSLEAYKARDPQHAPSKASGIPESWRKPGWFWTRHITTYGTNGEDGALPQTAYCMTDIEAQYAVEKKSWVPLWHVSEEIVAMLRAFYHGRDKHRTMPVALAEGLRQWDEVNKPAAAKK